MRRLLAVLPFAVLIACNSGGGGVQLPPCPSGTIGIYPACYPIPEPPKEPPKVCPAGTHGTPPNCEADTPPTPPPPPPPVERTPLCDSLSGHLFEDCWSFPPKPDGSAGDHFVWVCHGATVTVLDPKDCPAAPPPEEPPTPPGAGCFAPIGEWTQPLPSTTAIRPVVMQVLVALSGCPQGSGCPLPMNQQAWQAKVTTELRARGLCAGQHVAGVTDQVAVSTECAGRWESYYVFACTPARPGEVDKDGNPIDTCPIPGRGKVRWAIPADSWIAPSTSGCATVPPPIPPAPGPGTGACPAVATMLDASEPFRADIKPHVSGGGAGVDLTLWACGYDLVAKLKPDVRACLNFCCPLEGDKSATVDLNKCADELWGKASFAKADPASGVIVIPTPNTNTVVITGGGFVRVCGTLNAPTPKTCWTFVYPCTPDAADATKCQKDHK